MTEDPLGGHRIPAEAEFAISGYVPPHERRPEGPFGDHFGYYSLQHDFLCFMSNICITAKMPFIRQPL